MAHQYMSKIFHESQKNPPVPPPTYLMYGPLYFLKKTVLVHFQSLFQKSNLDAF